MIKDGVLEGVDEIYGIHLWNYQVGCPLLSSDVYNLTPVGSSSPLSLSLIAPTPSSVECGHHWSGAWPHHGRI